MYYTGTRYIYKYKCVVYDSVCLIYVDNECKYEKKCENDKKRYKKKNI